MGRKHVVDGIESPERERWGHFGFCYKILVFLLHYFVIVHDEVVIRTALQTAALSKSRIAFSLLLLLLL